MATTIAAAVNAGSARAAEPYVNYDTFSPTPPRRQLKRKEPDDVASPSPAASVASLAGSLYRAYDAEHRELVTEADSSRSTTPEPAKMGCWSRLVKWAKSLF